MEASPPLSMVMTQPPPAPCVALAESLEGEGVEDAEATSILPVDAASRDGKDTSTALLVEPAAISGYLWKFPSEGSVETTGGLRQEDKSYPRKCRRCGTCWVSDAANEAAHRRVCRSSAPQSNKPVSSDGSPSKLGPARRVFCEIDAQQAMLQWRFDDEAGGWSDCISLSTVRGASALSNLPSAFAVLTTGSRRLVFQIRHEPPDLGHESMASSVKMDGRQQVDNSQDAAQWCELLGRLCALEAPEAAPPESSDQEECDASSDELDDHIVDSVNSILSPGLRQAISGGDVDTFDELIGMEACHREMADAEGNSLLLLTLKLCPEAQLTAMIDRVLRLGVDPNQPNNELETPLLIAAASGNADTVRQLLEAEGVDVDLPGALGATPIHVAVNSGEMAIIELLCQHGADSSSADENGWTALHYAAACPSGLAAVHFLCELVPELIDAQCSEGNSALHVAAACGCVDNVRALLETAASPAVTNVSGQTPYRLALQSHKIQCALALNEYQQPVIEMVEEGSRLKVSTLEEDEIEAVRGVEVPEPVEEAVVQVGGDWVECETEDGLPYYYNSATGVSSWFKPVAETWAGDGDSDSVERVTEHPLGQELPLCLIPMVSPLTSLDDPTAATKLAEQRRKARESRRKRVVQQRRGR